MIKITAQGGTYTEENDECMAFVRNLKGVTLISVSTRRRPLEYIDFLNRLPLNGTVKIMGHKVVWTGLLDGVGAYYVLCLLRYIENDWYLVQTIMNTSHYLEVLDRDQAVLAIAHGICQDEYDDSLGIYSYDDYFNGRFFVEPKKMTGVLLQSPKNYIKIKR